GGGRKFMPFKYTDEYIRIKNNNCFKIGGKII
ncbi:hypothetical protein SFB3_107G1, partial [Candidatus Arthromitus sp. SFB-3]